MGSDAPFAVGVPLGWEANMPRAPEVFPRRVRVLHDGSHGVDTNWYTVVLDGGWLPFARGLKASMRMQAARGVTALWGHSGWGVPGGGVLLNASGTFGIASAVLKEFLESGGRFFGQAQAGK